MIVRSHLEKGWGGGEDEVSSKPGNRAFAKDAKSGGIGRRRVS
jgi:hypothetical protein